MKFRGGASPDVEVIFRFNEERKHVAYTGYRPDHMIKENYLTCGKHEYIDPTEAKPNSEVLGTITFLNPEAYPHCLWVGKKITFQEGARVVGVAEILKVLNPMLEKNCTND